MFDTVRKSRNDLDMVGRDGPLMMFRKRWKADMLTVARWGLVMAFLWGLGASVHAVRAWNFFRRGLRTDATVVAVERETRGAPPYAPYVDD